MFEVLGTQKFDNILNGSQCSTLYLSDVKALIKQEWFQGDVTNRVCIKWHGVRIVFKELRKYRRLELI